MTGKDRMIGRDPKTLSLHVGVPPDWAAPLIGPASEDLPAGDLHDASGGDATAFLGHWIPALHAGMTPG
jgi:hypothetical protein